MISSYRLGDLILLDLDENSQNEILMEHPDSIGSKYILEKRKNNDYDNINIVTNLVLEHIEKNNDFLPKDITDSTLIHLRLGDVISGNEWHEKIKRPLTIEHIKSLVQHDHNKKYIIGKCFFAKTSSINYDECIHSSNEYLQTIINEIQGEHLNYDDADIALCCAVKSKIFIQGRGFFSKLIVEIRKKLNLNSIETETTVDD